MKVASLLLVLFLFATLASGMRFDPSYEKRMRQSRQSTSGDHIPSPPSDTPVCTEDAKMCPDGSSVGRTGPNCEFAPCPQEHHPVLGLLMLIGCCSCIFAGCFACVRCMRRRCRAQGGCCRRVSKAEKKKEKKEKKKNKKQQREPETPAQVEEHIPLNTIEPPPFAAPQPFAHSAQTSPYYPQPVFYYVPQQQYAPMVDPSQQVPFAHQPIYFNQQVPFNPPVFPPRQ